ncbi:diguanylate cyclase [Haliea sp.]
MSRLKRNLAIFFILAVAILGSLTMVTLVIARQELDNNQLSMQSTARLLVMENLVTTLFESESSQRAYTVTGQPFFLDEHWLQRRQLEQYLTQLLEAEMPAGQRRDVEHLADLVRQRTAIMDRLIETANTQGQEAVIAEIAGGEGKRSMDAIRAASARLTDAERRRMSGRSATANRHLIQLLTMVPMASAVSLLLFIIAIAFTLAALRRNKELVDELTETGSDIRLINQLSSSLQSSDSREDAAQILNHYMVELFPDKAGALYLMRASRNMLELTTAWNASDVAMPLAIAPADCWALRLGRTYEAASPNDLRCHHNTDSSTAYLCVPLMAQGDIIGMIHFRDHSMEDIKPLAQFTATHIGAALAGISLRETLRQQSIKDPLTGLFNRRYLEETLEREMHRAKRNNSPLSLVMLDIDHFKQFNDRYGHPAGDLLLKEFGNNLRAHVRGQDIACRYGGEEFILVLPDATAAQAHERAETIRQSLVSLTVDYQGVRLPAITASFGVAAYPVDGDDWESLQRLADRALYYAKANGRDQVATATDTIEQDSRVVNQ